MPEHDGAAEAASTAPTTVPAPGGPEDPQDAAPGGSDAPEFAPHGVSEPEIDLEAMPSVFDGLRADYARVDQNRTEIIPIVPGRFNGRLGARYRPVDQEVRDKRQGQLVRQGLRGGELEQSAQAQLLVLATESIVMRHPETNKWTDLAEFNRDWQGGPAVKWDTRLCAALNIDLAGATLDEVAICRIVFKNPSALEQHFTVLDMWIKEDIAVEREDDEERPT